MAQKLLQNLVICLLNLVPITYGPFLYLEFIIKHNELPQLTFTLAYLGRKAYSLQHLKHPSLFIPVLLQVPYCLQLYIGSLSQCAWKGEGKTLLH